MTNEQTLLHQLSLGDRKAFAAIYEEYGAGIYNYLLKFTKDPVLTEDLVHDVFLKVWEVRDQLNVRSSFGAYLYRIARNTAITQLNRISLYDTIRDELMHRISLNNSYPELMNEIEAKQYQGLLQQAIHKLSPQRREAFELVRQQGMSYEEAALHMNISRHTLKEYLTLAVKSIKEYLLAHGDISLLMLLIVTLK